MAYRYRVKGNKYQNKQVTIDGITFDSKREAIRYMQLSSMLTAGDITNLQRQVKYVLIPTQREPDIQGPRGGIKKGRVIEKECAYIADFVYKRDGQTVVEDTKGVRTTEYIIKRKLMLWVHGIRITEV